MSESEQDVLKQWSTIEEIALTRSRGQPVSELLRSARPISYDDQRDELRIEISAGKINAGTRESFRNLVSKACFQVLGFKPSLIVESTKDAPTATIEVEVSSTGQALTPPKVNVENTNHLVVGRLSPHLDFDHFVVGPSNQLAHAASLAVAENPGRAYNPLFLHGSVGLGKTHLLNAICLKLLPKTQKIRMMSCEAFVNQFVSALKAGSIDKLRDELRDSDVLVIDDIHFLSGKEQTQEEFFHTFNHLYQQGKQIVLSSDSLPRDIPKLEDRLISRFHWGLAVKLEPPCTETRMAIVTKKAEARGVSLPTDVVDFLARNITSNVRELEGAVVQLAALSSVTRKPITMDTAHEALRHLVNARPAPTRVATDDIIEAVCEHYNVRRSDVLSQRRTKNLAFPRHVAMFLTKELTTLTLSEIGNTFGGRDHSTVLHGINKIRGLRLKDNNLRAELERLEMILRRPSNA